MASGWPGARGWKPEEADLGLTNSCPSCPQRSKPHGRRVTVPLGGVEQRLVCEKYSSQSLAPYCTQSFLAWAERAWCRSEERRGGRPGSASNVPRLGPCLKAPGDQLGPLPRTHIGHMLLFPQAQGPSTLQSKWLPAGRPGGLRAQGAHGEAG